MSNDYSSEILDELDDYPEVTQADLDRATFRVGLKPALTQGAIRILYRELGVVETVRFLRHSSTAMRLNARNCLAANLWMIC